MTLPEPPPCMAVEKVSRFKPPFCLSPLWHVLQRFLKIVETWSWNVTLALASAARLDVAAAEAHTRNPETITASSLGRIFADPVVPASWDSRFQIPDSKFQIPDPGDRS